MVGCDILEFDKLVIGISTELSTSVLVGLQYGRYCINVCGTRNCTAAYNVKLSVNFGLDKFNSSNLFQFFFYVQSEKYDGDVPRPYYARRWKRNRVCVILPWFLFAVCFLMLGFSMCWGWNQHRQVLKLMRDNHDKNVSFYNFNFKKITVKCVF